VTSFSQTQKGNNNAYCQDNELTWLHWDLDAAQQYFLAFVKKVHRIWTTNLLGSIFIRCPRSPVAGQYVS